MHRKRKRKGEIRARARARARAAVRILLRARLSSRDSRRAPLKEHLCPVSRPACVLRAAEPTAPRMSAFFMYTDAALDLGWLEQCSGFQQLRQSARGEGLAEVGLRQALVGHPQRTFAAAEAALFYIPLWEYASFAMGVCNGTTHRERMERARHALQGSHYFRRHGGADHFWGSSKSQARRGEGNGFAGLPASKWWNGLNFQYLALSDRLGPLSSLLKRSIVGRYKPYLRGRAAVGACTFELPYQPNVHALRDGQQRRAEALAMTSKPQRARVLLYFAGSLDVCCIGSRIRCAFARLVNEEDVIILPTTRPDAQPGQYQNCTVAAYAAAHSANMASSQTGHRPNVNPWTQAAETQSYETMGKAMARADFCLTPPGDNAVSSRLYSAVAAGCVPVLPFDSRRGAIPGSFHSAVNYSAFRVQVSAKRFIASPRELVARLRAMPSDELLQRQRMLAESAKDLLYEGAGSRAGTHVLAAATRCRDTTDSSSAAAGSATAGSAPAGSAPAGSAPAARNQRQVSRTRSAKRQRAPVSAAAASAAAASSASAGAGAR